MTDELQLNNVSPTPYDDVFRTECEKMKDLLIPLINELFGENYDISVVNIGRDANEHYTITEASDDIDIEHRISDSCLRIGNKLYHVECQSTEDGSILMRLVEYNIRIAFENASYDGTDRVMVDLPQSALIMLRSGSEGSEKLTHKAIDYKHGDQHILVDIPVLNVGAYSEDDIFEKKLYFLVPFYAIRYEKVMDRIAKDAAKEGKISLELQDEYDKMCSEVNRFLERLLHACETEGLPNEYIFRDLIRMSRFIMRHLCRKLEDRLRERLVNSMVGRILDLPSDEIRRAKAESWAKGKAVGEAEGEAHSIEKLATHYLREHPDWSKEKAFETAKSILK